MWCFSIALLCVGSSRPRYSLHKRCMKSVQDGCAWGGWDGRLLGCLECRWSRWALPGVTSSLLPWLSSLPLPWVLPGGCAHPVSMWKQDEGSSLRVLLPAEKKVLTQEVFLTSARVCPTMHFSCLLCALHAFPLPGWQPPVHLPPLPSDSLVRFCLLDAS